MPQAKKPVETLRNPKNNYALEPVERGQDLVDEGIFTGVQTQGDPSTGSDVDKLLSEVSQARIAALKIRIAQRLANRKRRFTS